MANPFSEIAQRSNGQTIEASWFNTIRSTLINSGQVKNNNGASTAPTTTDDSNSGYEAGSAWADTTNNRLYLCVDNTSSAAVWKEVLFSDGTLSSGSVVNPDQLDAKLDTKANLETYAASASNGQFVFATDEKKMYQIVDNALTAIGGGGLGTLDTIYQETFEDNDIIDAGVTLSGTGAIADEESSPISGTRSLKYTQDGAGSAGDIIDISGITFDDKVAGNLVGLLLDLKGSSELTEGYKVSLYESADDATYTEVSSVTVSAKAINVPVQVTGQILSTSLYLGLRVETLVASANHEILIDNILFRTRPLPIVNFNNMTDTVSYTPTLESTGGGAITLNATGSTPINGTWARDGDRMKVYVSFRNGSGGVATGASGNVLISIPSGYQIDFDKLADSVGGLNNVGQGEFFGPEDRLIVGAVNATQVRFTMNDGGLLALADITANDLLTATFEVPIVGWSAQGEGVVTQQTVTEGEREAFTPTGSYTTNATYTGFKQKIGDGYKYQMKVAFSGATDSGTFSFNVPDGTIDIAKMFAESDNRLMGQAIFHDASQPKFYALRVKYLNDSTVELVYFDDDAPYEELLPFQNASISTFAAGDEVMLEFEVPIVGVSAIEKNVTVVSPFKTEITTGTEYLTGEVIDGKPVYEYVYEVPSDITSTATIVSNPVGIVDPVGHLNYSGNAWSLLSRTLSSDSALVWYDRASGNIEAFVAGTYKIGAGVVIRFKYTK